MSVCVEFGCLSEQALLRRHTPKVRFVGVPCTLRNAALTAGWLRSLYASPVWGCCIQGTLNPEPEP